jgi:hypothetical protein
MSQLTKVLGHTLRFALQKHMVAAQSIAVYSAEYLDEQQLLLQQVTITCTKKS